MYSIDFYYAVMMELERQHKRRSQQKNLRQSAGLRQLGNKFGRKLAHWFGTKMIAWGSKLQNLNTTSPADIVVNPRLSR